MYLRRFSSCADDRIPQVEVFRKLKGWFTPSIDNIGLISNDNSVNVSGVDPTIVEKLFGEIESICAPILKNKIDKRIAINEDDKFGLALFIATLRMRNPFTRNTIETGLNKLGQSIYGVIAKKIQEDPNYLKQLIQAYQNDTGKDMSDIKSEDFKFPVQIQVQKEIVIGTSLSPLFEIASLLAKMNWHLFEAPEGMRFIASDFPYHEFNPKAISQVDGCGLVNPDIEIVVPLSSSQCLFISHVKRRLLYLPATNSLCLEFNKRIIQNAQDNLITFSCEFSEQEMQIKKMIEERWKM